MLKHKHTSKHKAGQRFQYLFAQGDCMPLDKEIHFKMEKAYNDFIDIDCEYAKAVEGDDVDEEL